MKNFVVFCIKVYQQMISPYTTNSCRFTPTCSQYAIDVFSSFSFLKSCKLSIKRLLKCHPCNKNGYDPPPIKKIK